MLYMFFADGFEEVEAIATLDVIRRAGISVESVGIGSQKITGSHNISVFCDKTESDILFDETVEGIILPGGMPGTMNLMNSATVSDFIDLCHINNKLLCAICAAPMILGRKGLLNGKKAICFPGFESELSGAVISDAYVCRDDNIITSKGMGSAINFGLEIVAALTDRQTADKLKSTLQCS